MAKPRNKYRDYLVYVAARLFVMFVHMFSISANYRAARLIGDLLYRFDRRHRRRALGHLRLSFPGWSGQQYARTARASMRNVVYLGLEVLFTPRLITPATWRRHVSFTNMSETVRLLVKQETGLIFVCGHFGNWEVTGYMLAILGFPTYAVARPLDNPHLNEYILGVRERSGLHILDKKGATESMDAIFRDKHSVSFIADQDAGRKGIFVDFFGRPASTYKSIALMAMQYNAPVIVCCNRRLDEEYHFNLSTERIIHPHEWADKPDPLRWITEQYTAALEQAIRTSPQQYFWMHRRWKHRPKGDKPTPDGIA